MNMSLRFASAVAIALLSLAHPSTAEACSSETLCNKTASPSVIGPTYPAAVQYTIDLIVAGCGCVWNIQDTLADYVAPGTFAEFTPTNPFCYDNDDGPRPEALVYSLEVTWSDCVAKGTEQVDGSFVLPNRFWASGEGSPFELSPPFSCEQTITCVPPPGCAWTPGYWKTHSSYGPAPYDDTWAKLPNGADTAFFSSGQSYHQVLWTPSGGGNAYYILGRAYIAAQLNVLAGASMPTVVSDAYAWAQAFFGLYGPSSTLSKTVRATAISKAGILDDFNNRITAPDSCTE